jgi:opacity protein-like surface antigen
MTLTRTTLVFTAALMLGSAAYAADDAITWTGFYAGLSATQSFADGDIDYAHETPNCSNNNLGSEGASDVCAGKQDYATGYDSRASRLAPGLLLGYGKAYDGIIIGLESDVMFNTDDHHAFEQISNGFGDTLDLYKEQKALVTLKAFAGTPIHKAFVYVTAGVAAGDIKSTIVQDIKGYAVKTISETEWQFGYVFGGGVKYNIVDNWVLGAEALHMKLSDSTLHADESYANGGLHFPNTDASFNNSASMVRTSLARRF